MCGSWKGPALSCFCISRGSSLASGQGKSGEPLNSSFLNLSPTWRTQARGAGATGWEWASTALENLGETAELGNLFT